MFQVSNPLKVYTQNPNADDYDEPAEVPTLSQSQIRLKQTNKTISNIIYFCVGVLILILLATLGLTIYHKFTSQPSWIDTIIEQEEKMDVSNCSECLNYENLHRLVEIDRNIPGAENYVNETIERATKANIDKDTADVASLRNVNEKMATIPRLKQKIDELLRLNATFGEVYEEGLKNQGDIDRLKNEFDVKGQKIIGHRDRVLEVLKGLVDYDKNKANLETSLARVRNDINSKQKILDEERKDKSNGILTLRKRITEHLQEAGEESEQKLDDVIYEKAKRVQNLLSDKAACESDLFRYREEMSSLRLQLTQQYNELSNVEHQLSRMDWVNHVLETIRKFKDIRQQLIDLRTTQLEEGKININKIIKDLEEDIEIFKAELLNIPKEETVTNKTIIVEEHPTITQTIQMETITRRNVYDKIVGLKNHIQKEQDLLKTWANGQFMIYNISTNEINNITATMENLENSLKDQTREYQKFSDLREQIEINIIVIKTNLSEFESSVQRCNIVVAENQKLAGDEQRELARLQPIQEKINKLKRDIAKEEEEQKASNPTLVAEIETLQAEEKRLIGEINDGIKNQNTKREELRRIVEEINDEIKKDPQRYVVNKEIDVCSVKIQKTNEKIRELLALIDDIRKFI